MRATATRAPLAAAALVAAGLLAASLAAAPSPATHPADSASSLESRWSTVLERLASDSFKERQDAQKEVDKATWHDLPALRALAAKVTDPEVKERLMNRVESLEVEAALNPPPIDFDVQDGSLRDVSIALENATGIPWRTWNQGGPPQLFTLHAKDKPLWEVFMALNSQHPMRIQNSGDVQLWFDSQGIRRGDLQGPLLFYARSLARVLDLQAPDQPANPDNAQPGAESPTPGAPSLQFSYGVLGDPRLKIVKAWTPQITEAIDDKGNVLFRSTAQNNGWTNNPLLLQQETSDTWPIPENLGKKITVKGTMKLSLILSETTVEIPDMVKQGNTPILVGDEEIVWDKFEPKDNIINFQMSVRPKGGGPVRTEMLPVRITLTDNAGTPIISQSIEGSWGGGLGMNNAAGPIKATFSIPTRTQDQQYNFQFKDLPIP